MKLIIINKIRVGQGKRLLNSFSDPPLRVGDPLNHVPLRLLKWYEHILTIKMSKLNFLSNEASLPCIHFSIPFLDTFIRSSLVVFKQPA